MQDVTRLTDLKKDEKITLELEIKQEFIIWSIAHHNSFYVYLRRNERTVEKLTELIEQEQHIPKREQILTCNGSDLEDLNDL